MIAPSSLAAKAHSSSRWVLILLACFGFATQLIAGQESFTNRISGASIAPTQQFQTEDDKLTFMVNTPGWATYFSHGDVNGDIILRIDPNDLTVYNDFTATVDFDVTFTDEDLVVHTFSSSLDVSYDPVAGTSYKNEDRLRIPGAHKISVTVTNTSTNLGSFPTNLELIAEIEVDRIYAFNPFASTTISAVPIQSNSFIQFSWPPQMGAESYELEWVWIDDYGSNGGFQSPGDLDFDFDQYATRVSTPHTWFQTSYVFEHGYLLYRVRALGRHASDASARFEGAWSSSITSGAVNSFSDRIHLLSPHESDDFNWSFGASYAENGKHAEGVGYMDGLLRGRQSVGRSNSKDLTIAAETFYDYQGRPTLSALPAPTFDKELKYYPNFNRDALGGSYGPEDFDTDPNDSCANLVSPMSTASGASRYYSPNNPDQEGAQAWLPDAEEYPFAHVEYTPDFTGRVRRSGAFGPEHQLGTGHETRYFYVDPFQERLNSLFGTDIGWSNHYKEIFSIDPNGQGSSSIIDQDGKVVMTMLSGDATPGTSPLPSNSGSEVDTVSLLDVNAITTTVDNETVIRMQRTMAAKVAGNYNFSYGMTAEMYRDSCLNAEICFDCIYDLTISIIDECGNQMITSGPITTTIGTIPLDSICNDSVHHTEDFSVYLTVGSYTVIKELTVNKAAVDYYTEQYLENDSCLLTYEDFYQNFLDSLDFSGCGLTPCENEALDSLGTREAFVLAGGTEEDYNQLYADFLVYCLTEDPCQELMDAMLFDVSPNGQYGLYLDSTLTINPILFPLSVFNTNNQLPDANANWRNPTTPYVDEDGNPSVITINGVNYAPEHPSVTLALFLANWEDSWAASLVTYHPEYCYYDWCQLNAASHAWDDEFASAFSFDEANTLGYFNPVNMTLGQGKPGGVNTVGANLDPFFASGGQGAGVASQMQNLMQNYLVMGSSTYTIWQAAQLMTFCPSISTAAQADSCLLASGTFGSNDCKTDDLWFAFQDMYTGLKAYYYDSLATDYAILNGCYNGCIGEQTAGWHTFVSCYPMLGASCTQDIKDGYDAWADPEQPCNDSTANLYANKVSIHGGYPVPDSLDTFLVQTITGIVQTDSAACLYTCESYADSWFMALAPCGIDPADSVNIRQQLIEICSIGCLLGNPYGASIITPDTNSFGNSTFQQVLNQYGYTQHDSCAATLIANPYAWDHDYTGSFATADTCFCDRVLENNFEFLNQPLPNGITTEFDLFLYNYGVMVPNLQSMVCDCDEAFAQGGGAWSSGATWPVASQTFLDGAQLYAPNALTCEECLPCAELEDWKDSFALSLPNPMVDSSYYNVMLGNYLNIKLGYNLSVLEYKNFRLHCDSALNTVGDTFTLCNRSVFPTIPVDTTDDCMDLLIQQAAWHAQRLFEEYLDSASAAFQLAYTLKCTEAMDSEYFDMIYDNYEYHYTLYYYDQSGMLRKTVPPTGVVALSNQQTASINSLRKNHNTLVPAHTMETNYAYNAFGGPTTTSSPDGGTSEFWYDRLGRLVLSQNAQQKVDDHYSYTLFDDLGRIAEVGQLESVPTPTEAIVKDPSVLDAWIASKTKTEITRSFYDEPLSSTIAGHFAGGQNNLRLRVATMAFYDTDVSNTAYTHATHYSYDRHGNVNELVQEIPSLNAIGHDVKRVAYSYELVSGNVVAVDYQDGASDAFHHRYCYDADNRLSDVETSPDDITWSRDAHYEYYDHGPLARTERGEHQVNAEDLAYTINGWMKGVNSGSDDASREQGKDGETGYFSFDPEAHARFARDVTGWELGYFDSAYTAISQPNPTDDWVTQKTNSGLLNQSGELFNGNIRNMVTAIEGMDIQATAYRYDQLNRLVELTAFQNFTQVTNSWDANGALNDYRTEITYDGNGNIITLDRNGHGSTYAMDNFIYRYIPGTNQLDHVDDNPANTANYAVDIDDQDTVNYSYNAIGQLIADADEQIKTITWNAYKKVQKIERDASSTKSDLEFAYNAAGQRILKIEKPRSCGGLCPQTDWTLTWYVRDAQGNILTTYASTYEIDPNSDPQNRTYLEHFSLADYHLYGSSRLGLTNVQSELTEAAFTAQIEESTGAFTGPLVTTVANYHPGDGMDETEITYPTGGSTSVDAILTSENLGGKRYEFTNHLGNVLAVINDRKLPNDPNTDNTIDFYSPDWTSTSDYYAFGMTMTNRNNSIGDYRFGFNGMEQDQEVKGDGNHYTTFFRQYDARLGRWFTTDPVTHPHESPYAAMANNPILLNDPDGDKPTKGWFKKAWGKTKEFIKHPFNKSARARYTFKSKTPKRIKPKKPNRVSRDNSGYIAKGGFVRKEYIENLKEKDQPWAERKLESIEKRINWEYRASQKKATNNLHRVPPYRGRVSEVKISHNGVDDRTDLVISHNGNVLEYGKSLAPRTISLTNPRSGDLLRVRTSLTIETVMFLSLYDLGEPLRDLIEDITDRMDRLSPVRYIEPFEIKIPPRSFTYQIEVDFRRTR